MALFLACVACVAAATSVQPAVSLALIVLAVCSFALNRHEA